MKKCQATAWVHLPFYDQIRLTVLYTVQRKVLLCMDLSVQRQTGSKHAKSGLEWRAEGLASGVVPDPGIYLQAETNELYNRHWNSIFYEVHSDLRHCISTSVWVGTAGRSYCPNTLALFEEISLERRSKLWNCRSEPKYRESQFVPSLEAKMNAVSSKWETWGPLYDHWCKIKDRLLCFHKGGGYPTAKLHCSLAK